MAAEQIEQLRPVRRARALALVAFLGLLGLAALPQLTSSAREKRDSTAPAPELLSRYHPEAGLAAICREPEILGEAHGMCGFGARRTSGRPGPGPVARPRTEDIRFAEEPPEPPSFSESPGVDHWEIGFSEVPAAYFGGGGGGGGLTGGVLRLASSGGGIGGAPLLLLNDGSGGGGGGNPLPECVEDCDPSNPVPEPTAALLFGLGFAAIARLRR